MDGANGQAVPAGSVRQACQQVHTVLDIQGRLNGCSTVEIRGDGGTCEKRSTDARRPTGRRVGDGESGRVEEVPEIQVG